MKGSTAKFVSYDLRPAKQAARRIMLDFLKCANEGGISVSDCRYVGMGGTRFYDFHLVHRFLGITNMVSLERDENFYLRTFFNCPYEFITVEQRTVADFLAADTCDMRSIFWFDYDDGISPEILGDIFSLGGKLTTGSFAFVTVRVDPTGYLIKQKPKQRLEYFQDTFGTFATGLAANQLENSAFPATVHQIILAAFKNAFASSGGAVFQPLLQIKYQDVAPMLIVGGCLSTQDQYEKMRSRVGRDLPFLMDASPYLIRNLNLTERERILFDLAVTQNDADSTHAISLRSFGFEQEDLNAYRDLLRFLPRYHESII